MQERAKAAEGVTLSGTLFWVRLYTDSAPEKSIKLGAEGASVMRNSQAKGRSKTTFRDLCRAYCFSRSQMQFGSFCFEKQGDSRYTNPLSLALLGAFYACLLQEANTKSHKNIGVTVRKIYKRADFAPGKEKSRWNI